MSIKYKSRLNIFLDNSIISIINELYNVITQPWKNMYENHIIPIKKNTCVNVLKSELTIYDDYQLQKNIKELPEWYILTTGTRKQKIFAIYDNSIDLIGFLLIDLYCSRGKTLIVFHTSNMSNHNGMHVSDIITKNIYCLFSNPLALNYIRKYIVSPEQVFMCKDHYISYYNHLYNGLIEPKLKRIIVSSSRHILLLIEILKDKKKELVDAILKHNHKRGTDIQNILYDTQNPDMKNIFKKIWQHLELIVLNTTGQSRIYTKQIKKYIGNIKLYSPIYTIPECTIGYDIYKDGFYIIDPRKGYFEFILVDNDYLKGSIKDKKTCSMSLLKTEHLYNIVVSSVYTNLNRYITNEIIKVIDYVNGVPKIDIICHSDDLLFTGKTVVTPYDIEIVLFKYFDITDYCFRKSNGKYKLYIELEQNIYIAENDYIYDIKDCIKNIDISKHLYNSLLIYFEVRIVSLNTFKMLYQKRFSKYIDPSIINIPRNITNKDDIEIIRDNIIYLFP
jgi:hypothetical protein